MAVLLVGLVDISPLVGVGKGLSMVPVLVLLLEQSIHGPLIGPEVRLGLLLQA
jgi:UPF0716 family protein affecting phage T7 exclusion